MSDDQAYTEEMMIADAVKKNPEAAGVFQKHGMHCIGCAIAHGESLGDGARAHGIDLNALIADLNALA